ncbi:MAG: glycoside hydrolase family 13 protein [Bacteroidales bacterium]|nr:glycoside hydrolase family 13 protein [Bacteroidales bacterium]
MKHKINLIMLAALAFFYFIPMGSLHSQELNRIEPPFWWAGMKSTELQLMVNGKDIGKTRVSITYPGVQLKETVLVENPNYLFLNLVLSPDVQPGTFQIVFETGKKKPLTFSYELIERAKGSAERQGFNNSDVIYLLMPDRFANGDPSNDNVDGMLEKFNRSNPNGRHGGDIKGIRDNLDYFNDLGVTALWLNPVLENNMPAVTYHGYAITDFYKVDARFGTNEDFRLLVEEAGKKGLRIIKDMVFNHFGTSHWWLKDLPMKDWINQWPEYTRSNYRGGTLVDPYASEHDKKLMLKGWFDTTMADLNQENPYVANYLIQNSIWWVEYAGLDGIRMDTYPYSGKEVMTEWMQRLRFEYPNFSVVGEVWLNTAPQVAYWMEDASNADGYNSHLNYLFDFPLKYAIGSAFNESHGWSSGVSKLYESLSLDYLYSNPQNIVVFADNHDADRIYTVLKEDMRKFKMAMAFLMTVRGFPQIYYGTELLMTGWEHDGHGFIREDFPGGWSGDEINAFKKRGLTADQNEAGDFLRMLLHWRKNKKVIHDGMLKHYVPEDGIYVYFRYNEVETVMVILNNNEESKTIKTERFNENLEGFTTGTDLLHRTYFDQLKMISVPAMSARIIELKK